MFGRATIRLGIGPHSSYEGAVCMLLGDDAGQHDVMQTSVSANNNDGDVDNVVNNNDCVSPSSNSKLSPFLMHVCFNTSLRLSYCMTLEGTSPLILSELLND